jgi:flavin-dependent dehydrogenase
MMVVGDAAGHVKPTTGGGVVFGGLAASVAGEEAASYSLNGDAEALERYEARWRRLIGRELSWMARLRRYLSSLSDEGYERLFKAAALLNLGGELARVGDMDLHALTAFRLSINPRLAPLAALVALGVLKESFKAKPIEGWGRRGVGSCLGR